MDIYVLKRWAIGIIFVGLTGCIQVPERNYAYVSPQTRIDRQCTHKCAYARKSCLKICRLKHKRVCRCTVSYNTCYIACGGAVVER